jgi:hypothetical protein
MNYRVRVIGPSTLIACVWQYDVHRRPRFLERSVDCGQAAECLKLRKAVGFN